MYSGRPVASGDLRAGARLTSMPKDALNRSFRQPPEAPAPGPATGACAEALLLPEIVGDQGLGTLLIENCTRKEFSERVLVTLVPGTGPFGRRSAPEIEFRKA